MALRALAVSWLLVAPAHAIGATVFEAGYGFIYTLGTPDIGSPNGVLQDNGQVVSRGYVNTLSGIAPGTGAATLAAARGDLATGEVGVSASLDASARLAMVETLRFDLTDLAFTDTVSIGLAAELNGFMPPRAFAVFNFSASDGSNSLSVATNYFTRPVDPPRSVADAVFSIVTKGESGGSWDVIGPSVYSGTIELRGGAVRDLRLVYELTGNQGANLMNTLSVDVITERPYASASGVFLTGRTSDLEPDPAVIPLPAGLPLLAGGLGLLAMIRRRTLTDGDTLPKLARWTGVPCSVGTGDATAPASSAGAA